MRINKGCADLKKVLSVFLSVLLVFSCSAVGFADAETKRIYYDYGFAELSGNPVKNENPDSYVTGIELVLTNASCDGYVFEGWYSDPAFVNKTETIGADSDSDIRVYAKWSAVKYSVTYVLSSPGDGADEIKISNPNPAYGLPGEGVALKDAKIDDVSLMFGGWYTDRQFENKINSLPKSHAGDITLYAKWVTAEYRITYDTGVIDLSEHSTDNPNPAFYTYNEEMTLLPASTDDNAYSFGGWYSDSEFKNEITAVGAGTHGEITLYAKWVENEYKIDYVLGGGNKDFNEKYVNNPNPDMRTAVGDTVLKNAEYDRGVFVFEGWYSDEERTQKTEFIPAGTCSDITLYAKWSEAVFKINYDYGILNEFKNTLKNDNITSYKANTSYKLKNVEKDGYVFNGWFLDSEYKTPVTAVTVDMTGDKTFYASYTEKTYSVTYVLTNDSYNFSETDVLPNNPNVRTTSESLTLNEPILANALYVFGGWYTEPEFVEKVDKIESGTAKNITLYAKWVRLITYIPVWGDASLSNGLTSSDARSILRYSARLESFTSEQLLVSDINNDGVVNASDARLTLRVCAKLENMEAVKVMYNLGTITAEDGKIVVKK